MHESCHKCRDTYKCNQRHICESYIYTKLIRYGRATCRCGPKTSLVIQKNETPCAHSQESCHKCRDTYVCTQKHIRTSSNMGHIHKPDQIWKSHIYANLVRYGNATCRSKTNLVTQKKDTPRTHMYESCRKCRNVYTNLIKYGRATWRPKTRAWRLGVV